MALDLPARERSFYGAAPLIEVICQIRFPRLLVLENELPVEFQEAVSDTYPILETRSAINFQAAGSPTLEELPLALRASAYDFFDEQRQNKITLTSDFVAVTTAKYTAWEDFRGRIRAAIDALLGAYDIRLFQRTGLRYQNVIRPEALGLAGAGPTDLFIAELLGPASTVSDKLRQHQSTTLFELGDGSLANLSVAITYEGEPKSPAYVVDCDAFDETQAKPNMDGTLELLERLHGNASHLFRWCIQEPLHAALDPKPC